MPLAEHDQPAPVPRHPHIRFNSRAPRGARPGIRGSEENQNLCFNSRAPRGARPASPELLYASASFNSRAPRGARPSGTARDIPISRFQFTCPSRSTTFTPKIRRIDNQVSIHVPLAEHDVRQAALGVDGVVSIHVPLAEHDCKYCRRGRHGLSFNSRAPRGARHGSAGTSTCACRFNSRAPRGARHWLLSNGRVPQCFNSRAPRGARPAGLPPPCASRRFNSRAPRGARPVQLEARAPLRKFQFTCPSRSTTGCAVIYCHHHSSFNSRAPRGARHAYAGRTVLHNPVSIHVPLAEHDASSRSRRRLSESFQFTCPSRSTTVG